MDLYEYQGKQFFASYGIPVSPGEAVTTVDDAVAAAERIGYPVVVKAQVQVGGRGKAGGIKLANDADEVRTHAGNILGMDIKGHTVEIVWIELASDIAEEYYASFTLDRSAKKHLGHALGAGRRGDRGRGGDRPRRHRQDLDRPRRRAHRGGRPGLGGGGQARTRPPPRAPSTSSASSTRPTPRATPTSPRSTR